MSNIKTMVSAATAQWLPVALGALAVPSGARHQRKSPQSQGPSACVSVWNMLNVIMGSVLWEPPWKDPTQKPQKLLSVSSLRLLASLFIFAKGSRMRREDSLSLFLCLSLSLSDRQDTHHCCPPALLIGTSHQSTWNMLVNSHLVSAHSDRSGNTLQIPDSPSQECLVHPGWCKSIKDMVRLTLPKAFPSV